MAPTMTPKTVTPEPGKECWIVNNEAEVEVGRLGWETWSGAWFCMGPCVWRTPSAMYPTRQDALLARYLKLKAAAEVANRKAEEALKDWEEERDED